jgi:hypothetical protein
MLRARLRPNRAARVICAQTGDPILLSSFSIYSGVPRDDLENDREEK